MTANGSKDVSVSYVIRTYNEAEFIGRLLETLRAQKAPGVETEVIVVDSGSTDKTVEILEGWPVRLLKIKKSEFNYGKALNLGIRAAKGELIAMLSAHAIPTSNDWLGRMTMHFRDERVAGVFGRQVPWPDAQWREVRRLKREFAGESVVYTGSEDVEKVSFSNAASCIRRAVWEEHSFAALPGAEDLEWAKWALATGYRVVYEADVAVFHSHKESSRESAQRVINFEKAADETRKRPRNLVLTGRQAAGLAYRDLRYVAQLEKPERNRWKLATESLARAYWFYRDFR